MFPSTKPTRPAAESPLSLLTRGAGAKHRKCMMCLHSGNQPGNGTAIAMQCHLGLAVNCLDIADGARSHQLVASPKSLRLGSLPPAVRTSTFELGISGLSRLEAGRTSHRACTGVEVTGAYCIEAANSNRRHAFRAVSSATLRAGSSANRIGSPTKFRFYKRSRTRSKKKRQARESLRNTRRT